MCGSADQDSVGDKVDDALEGNRKIQSTWETAREIDQRARVAQWLASSDPFTNHHKALQQRHRGTGRWFLESSDFKQWKANPKSFLWLHGIPGCGKTVLSSTIIEHLEQDMTCQLLTYFYFDFNDKDKQSLDSLLRSLIVQVYQSQPDSRQPLEQLWASHGEGSRGHLRAICKVFYKSC